MTGLLESHFLWSSLGWICLLGLSLWLITVLFPAQGPSDDHPLEDATNREAKEDAPLIGANQILHTENKEN